MRFDWHDPAFTGDRAALAIVAPPKVEGADFRVLHYETFHGLDYEQQASKIADYCKNSSCNQNHRWQNGYGEGFFSCKKISFPLRWGWPRREFKNDGVEDVKLAQKRRLYRTVKILLIVLWRLNVVQLRQVDRWLMYPIVRKMQSHRWFSLGNYALYFKWKMLAVVIIAINLPFFLFE